ncbi:RNA-guided endonuclease InsQ/TnpB family protein [Streptomyces mirabilis]|uniref:RNA-guided endonuclease InsQ/TnpB family protein n=1 Tax=Streptomyces mirabilis TaxID=68239 RepID=UPI0036865F1D
MDTSGRWRGPEISSVAATDAIAITVIAVPVDAPGTGEAVGIDRGVKITAALSDGRKLNCPQLTVKERAQIRKHQRRAARAPRGSEARTAECARVARLRAREADRRKDWCEKTSTMLARTYDLVRFEKLNIKNMTRSAKGTVEQPGRNVRQKAGLNRAILAQGWGLLRQRTEHKAPGRVEDVPAPFTSLRCSACGWIERKSRKSQARVLRVHMQRRRERSKQCRGRTGRVSPPPAISRCRRGDSGHQPFERP